MFAWMENLVPCSGTMLAALDDMGWLIFVIIAILSSLFGGKKKEGRAALGGRRSAATAAR